MRVGLGYDVHKLVANRKLVLGGITISYEKGLLGHSDADVVLHAVCDALLGAAGLGDIGMVFPDSDPEYKDIYSLILLEKTFFMIDKKGFSVVNIDVTIFAQAPKLFDYKKKMSEKIAEAIKIDKSLVNIKATTTEKLGTIGKGDAIAAMCVVLLD